MRFTQLRGQFQNHSFYGLDGPVRVLEREPEFHGEAVGILEPVVGLSSYKSFDTLRSLWFLIISDTPCHESDCHECPVDYDPTTEPSPISHSSSIR